MNFRLSLEPIDPSALQAALRDARAGACATFEGWVRVRNEGREVQALDYEAYRPLAEKEGARILDEARARFGFIAAVCVHRLGPLVPGDLAIWVGVTAEHRGAAFEACRAIVDEVSITPAGRRIGSTRRTRGRRVRRRGRPLRFEPDRSGIARRPAGGARRPVRLQKQLGFRTSEGVGCLSLYG
jgi:molybdopterin synthase catalytic subunit